MLKLYLVSSMKEVMNKYLNDKLNLEKYQKIGIICLVIVIAGVFGWLYEYIFYFFNSGMKTFYMRGANFLPWINIYATGSLMIMFLTRKFKKKPWLVFLIAFISTGILEYFSGLGIYLLRDGMRCWDYNTEILNFGNIHGFVCLRSVMFFGLSGLLLIYAIVPLCTYLSIKMPKKPFMIISITLCTIFLFDEFYNLLFARILHTPRAIEVYKRFGIKYMNYFKN